MEQVSESTLSLYSLFIEFRVAIIASLIGAIIGHYKSNGFIQMPTVTINYEQSNVCKGNVWLTPINWIICAVEIILFILGIRFGKNRKKGTIVIELGFMGDMLVGIGAGILAKATLSLADTTNLYSVISASLLAGFGGLSYIQSQQSKSLNRSKGEYEEIIDSLEDIKPQKVG